MRFAAFLIKSTTEDEPMITTEYEIITPEKAAEYLKLNTCNRSISAARVKSLVEQIKNGKWQPYTHQGIAFGENGKLFDGQHRLLAVLQSNTPITILVTRNLPESTLGVIDTGKTRSAADLFSMNNYKCGRKLAAGTRIYVLYEMFPDQNWVNNHQARLTSEELLRNYKKFIGEEKGEIALTLSEKIRQFPYVNPAALFAFVVLCCDAGHQRQHIEDFVKQLIDGEGLSSESPVFRFRKNLLKKKYDRSRIGSLYLSQMHLALLIKVFNFYSEGKTLSSLSVPDFPPMPKILKSQQSYLLPFDESQDKKPEKASSDVAPKPSVYIASSEWKTILLKDYLSFAKTAGVKVFTLKDVCFWVEVKSGLILSEKDLEVLKDGIRWKQILSKALCDLVIKGYISKKAGSQKIYLVPEN